MNPIIETKNLTRKFEHALAVRDLNLEVAEGSIYALLGSNGAGKTTAIQMIMNVLAPSSGSARVMGMEAKNLGPQEWQKIGYVSENQRLPEWMTLRQLIGYCRPFYPSWDDALCEKLRIDFALSPDRKIGELSLGMKMKAALLSVLSYRPQLLVLDEPFNGLDVLVREDFIAGVMELSGQEKWSVLISSHDIDEIEKLADHVGFMSGGRLELQESTESLQDRFRSVEVILEGAMDSPPPLSAGWLVQEKAGNVFRFVDSRFATEEAAERTIRSFIPGAASCSFSPMPLRNIFLAIARSSRKKQAVLG